MGNYFNKLTELEKKNQLNICRFMNNDEFSDGVNALIGKKIVIVGCGAQGLNQGLNMRDSGLDISYVLRQSSIDSKKESFLKSSESLQTQGFKVLADFLATSRNNIEIKEIGYKFKNSSRIIYYVEFLKVIFAK